MTTEESKTTIPSILSETQRNMTTEESKTSPKLLLPILSEMRNMLFASQLAGIQKRLKVNHNHAVVKWIHDYCDCIERWESTFAAERMSVFRPVVKTTQELIQSVNTKLGNLRTVDAFDLFWTTSSDPNVTVSDQLLSLDTDLKRLVAFIEKHSDPTTEKSTVLEQNENVQRTPHQARKRIVTSSNFASDFGATTSVPPPL